MTDDNWTRSVFGDGAENEPTEDEEREGGAPVEPVVEPETLEPVPAEPAAIPTPIEAEPHRVFAGTGISWAFIFGTLVTVAIIVLAVQNTDRVPVKLYFWDLDAPLIIVMLVTALAAIVVDEMIGLIIRRRRRRMLAEREELKRLRARNASGGGRIE